MYFIKHPNSFLEGAEKFLRNRDFETYGSTDFKNALMEIMQIKPDYVFVCLDHPNKKITMIPKLLAQAFPVLVIPYLHVATASSIKLLHNTSSEYKLHPPSTGPSIQRLLNKIKKDQTEREEAPLTNKTKESGEPSTNENAVIKIGGQGKQQDVWSFRAEEAKKALDSFLMNDDSSVTGNLFTPLEQNAEKDFELQAPVPKNNLAKPNSDKTNDDFQQQKKKLFSALAEKERLEAEAKAKKESAKAAYERNQAETQALDARRREQLKAYSETRSQTNSPELKSLNQVPSPDSHPSRLESFKAGDKIKSLSTKKSIAKNPSQRHEGLEQAVEDSVSQLSVGSYEEKIIEYVQNISNATCLSLVSKRFTGYLVAAFGNQQKMEPEFVELMKRRLFEFLLIQGEEVNSGDNLQVKIREVAFDSWAIEQAEFLKKSVHNGTEVAMAFFPTTQANPQIGPLQPSAMMAIPIDDIRDDKPVEFNVYIYLIANKKYILYTATGGYLEKEQKERLKSRGIHQLHLHKDSIHSFKRYRAEGYLNDRVDEFYSSKNSKKEGAA